MKLIFFGDSNTYGYDPRGFMGMRYDERIIWPALVGKELTDYEVINEGLNGRMVPSLPREQRMLDMMFAGADENDIISVMLGTNDILLTDHPDAGPAIEKMSRLLDYFEEHNPVTQVIVVGPVLIDCDFLDSLYYDESVRLNRGYEELSQKHGIPFFDAANWKVPLTGDGVHFSEEGHRVFAEEYVKAFKDTFSE